MLTKYYRLQNFFLGIGFAVMILSFFNIIPLLCKVLAGISFIIGMSYYYKIISMLEQVTDLTPAQMWMAIASHAATLSALYFWNHRTIFTLLFVGSIILRNVLGIVALDRQMKLLCTEFDENIRNLALEDQSQSE